MRMDALDHAVKFHLSPCVELDLIHSPFLAIHSNVVFLAHVFLHLIARHRRLTMPSHILWT